MRGFVRKLVGRALFGAGVIGTASACPMSAATAGTALDAAAPPALVLEVSAGGDVSASGQLPSGLSPADLREIFPGLRSAPDLLSRGDDDPSEWRQALDALNVALPRIETAKIRVCARELRISGVLKPGFALTETAPALRFALGEGWNLVLALAEAPPAAELAFEVERGRITLSGLLPAGISSEQALASLSPAVSTRLDTGGGGELAAWSAALGALKQLAVIYSTATGRIEPGRLLIDGRLAPGQTFPVVRTWLVTALETGWTADITGEEQAALPGFRLVVPGTGEQARLVGGRWLPIPSFDATADRCDDALAHAQVDQRLAFASGTARLPANMAPLLDRLAGLAFHCLAAPGRRLEIEGHTDAEGDASANRALSLSRAKAVRAALHARGIPAALMLAFGRGAAHPIADNSTEEGRRRNRRIGLAWAGG